jgi:Family of unknown function (DUF6492)
MVELAVITPSYAPDFELCRDLNESVLRRTDSTVTHYVITPRRDLSLFSVLRGPRTEVLAVDEVMPRRMMAVPWANYWVNMRCPGPPIRGWMMQQLVKLQAATRISADRFLLVDSDVRFVRDVSAATFCRDGRLLFYRLAAGVHADMPRHVIWHDVARKLLGLPAEQLPLPDYVSAFNVWDRDTVLALRDRIERVTGQRWLDAIGRQLHFSEFILYGVFVDKVLGEQAPVEPTDSMMCHSCWNSLPLTLPEAERFVGGLPPDDVAIMISAKSGTPLDVRRKALATIT